MVYKKEKVIIMGVVLNISFFFVGYCKFFISFFVILFRKIWKFFVFIKLDVVLFVKCGRFL